MTLSCQGQGVSASRSIAVGPAFVIARCPCPATPGVIPPEAIDAELARLDAALDAARAVLRAVREQIPAAVSVVVAEFVDTHILMLEDAALVDAARELIRLEACSAEWALQRQRDALVRVFDAMDDPYLRNRRQDVDHVVRQIQTQLRAGTKSPSMGEQDLRGRIVIAEDLAPADAILLGQRGAGRLCDRVRWAHVPYRYPGAQPQHSRGGRRASCHPLFQAWRDRGGGWGYGHCPGGPGHSYPGLFPGTYPRLGGTPRGPASHGRSALRIPGRGTP